MNLVTELSWWYAALCLLLGGAYAGVLYWRSKALAEARAWLRTMLAVLRFLLVSFLAFLLLKPLLTTVFREVEKPIVVVAQDNSESLIVGKDSTYFREAYPQAMQTLVEQLAADYEVVPLSFGDQVTDGLEFNYGAKQTDVSTLLEEVYTRFSNRNLGAVIMASDGIVNRGANPVYQSGKIKAPIFTVALGDTAVRKDLLLRNVVHNRLAYLGNEFPLEVWVEAYEYRGETAKLTVSKDGETLYSEVLRLADNSFSATVPVLLEAKETGIQRYRIALTRLDGEVSYSNNVQDIYIDVLDGRQKILLLANAPHPDLGALRQTIETNDNYQVDVYMAERFTKSIAEYNLVILHQLPSAKKRLGAVMQQIETAGTPVWHILGAQSDLPGFNAQQAGLSIAGRSGRSNESQAVYDADFSLFTLSESTINMLLKYPPAHAPFGNYEVAPGATVLLRQKIGVVQTEMPLMLFNTQGETKSAVFSGEGLWRWRLLDYAENGNHRAFEELIGKTVQFLAVKEDKSFFRVFSRNHFLENEPVIFEAEVYNPSYELINDPTVTLEVIDREGNRFPFEFSATARSYRLNAGVLAVGEYQYVAKVRVGDKVYEETGAFSVSPIQIESVNTVADHQLLYQLASRHDGDLLQVADLAGLPARLQAREDIRPIAYTQKQLKDLINLKWVFFVLLSLLSLEWFLRKRSGAY